jgi:hypothetical protein
MFLRLDDFNVFEAGALHLGSDKLSRPCDILFVFRQSADARDAEKRFQFVQ